MSGRIRSVKPEWLEDELLAAASDEARVLSIGLILAADDYGNGRATIATIAADVWRYQMGRDDGAGASEVIAKASRAFRELLAMRFIGQWTERGQTYYAIRNWKRHQKVDKPGKPIVPSPPADIFVEKPAENGHSRDSRESVANPSRDSREGLAPDLRPTTNDQDQRADLARARDAFGDLGPEITQLQAHVRAALKPKGANPADLASPKWTDIARWCREMATDENPADAVQRRLAEGFAADNGRAAKAGYPLAYLAKNPSEFYGKHESRTGYVRPDSVAHEATSDDDFERALRGGVQ